MPDERPRRDHATFSDCHARRRARARGGRTDDRRCRPRGRAPRSGSDDRHATALRGRGGRDAVGCRLCRGRAGRLDRPDPRGNPDSRRRDGTRRDGARRVPGRGSRGLDALRRNCRLHAEVPLYTDSDWNRLAQNLAAQPSHCADYYISIPAIAGNKTMPRPDQAWRIRALGPRFHAMAEAQLTAWQAWVNTNNRTWTEAGKEFRRRMAAAGYVDHDHRVPARRRGAAAPRAASRCRRSGGPSSARRGCRASARSRPSRAPRRASPAAPRRRRAWSPAGRARCSRARRRASVCSRRRIFGIFAKNSSASSTDISSTSAIDFPLKCTSQGLAVVPPPVARLAGHVDVGQEVHLDLDLPVALARLAASAADVEREPPRLVAAHLRLGGQRVELADVGEEIGVGRRVGARRPADRRLVDLDHLVEAVDPLDAVVRAGLRPRLQEPVGEGLVDDLVDERRLARAGHARDADELARPGTRRRRPSGCARALRARGTCRDPRRAARAPRSAAFPRGSLPVTDRRFAHHLGRGSLRDDLSAVLARAGAHVDEPVGGAHHLLVVLDDDHGVAEVAQALERPDQAAVVALVEADRRLVEDVEDADELRADLRREPQPLRLAARERPGRAVEVQVADADVVEERRAARGSPSGSAARSAPRSASARARRRTAARP